MGGALICDLVSPCSWVELLPAVYGNIKNEDADSKENFSVKLPVLQFTAVIPHQPTQSANLVSVKQWMKP